ncbi:DEAD/DEAH box helicase [Sediminivirga luteola]|uniref:DEAD/DEAH box helicase n=1 Tax=Sediminivirga luteola TaxID=1774748 RepID=A0A8J2U1G8_9MICO|nr:DEAD/DEAH box helicase [Sediminivirga luteola]GGA28425.1 DEAD/DEAH box helicase [Sediminivirga luteola]
MARTLPLVPEDHADADTCLEVFSDWVREQGMELYPAQEEAIMAVLSDEHAIVSTPTGSGKSMIALAAHHYAVSTGRRSYYTAPLKALVSEKFFALVDVFGAEQVGMVTGDSAVNPEAPLICCTAEVLANHALRAGPGAGADQVVMDEFHFFADPQRGWAWQVPLIELTGAQFVLMSATLGELSGIITHLERRTGRGVSLISSAQRPVPLDYEYSEVPLQERLQALLQDGKAPVYVVAFAQAEAVRLAQSLTSAGVSDRAARDRIAEALGDFRFSTGFGRTLSRLVRHGIGVHHAGMLPRYRRLVEQLAQQGLLTVICGTDSLGVGINVPIRTVLLTGLTKYDGERTRHLSAREFHQIAGRAGRAGYDARGSVVLQAPEHVIENAKLLAKAGDAKKRRKIVKKKAPEGFVSWGRGSFERLIEAEPEPLVPRLRMSHAMVLNLLARPGATAGTVREFIESSLEPRPRQLDLMLRAIEIGRSLLAAGVLRAQPDGGFLLAENLGEDFALNQPLSPFAFAAFALFDPGGDEDGTSPGTAGHGEHAMNILSIVEAIVPAPAVILRAQRKAARDEAMSEMKAEGLDYVERMNALEEIGWPEPNGDLLREAFDAYAAEHPWVRDWELEPKAVVADMVAQGMSFQDFISRYQLARSEGAVLRYLSDLYRALRQTVPAESLDEELRDVIAWLGELVRQVDSSLLDEWEALMAPDGASHRAEATGGAALAPPQRPFSQSGRAFLKAVRNALFQRVLLAERGDYRTLGELDAEAGWTAETWEDAVEPYFDEYSRMDTGPAARSMEYLHIEKGSEQWRVRQAFADPEDNRDWAIEAVVDLPASDQAGEPVLRIERVGA